MCIILHNDIMYNSNQWYTIIIQQSQSFYLQPATHSGHEIIPQGPGWLRSLRCPEREGLDGGTPARGAGWCSTPTRNSAGQQLMEGLRMAKACSCFSTFLFINIYKHTCIKGLIDSLDLEWKKLLTLPLSHSLLGKSLCLGTGCGKNARDWSGSRHLVLFISDISVVCTWLYLLHS